MDANRIYKNLHATRKRIAETANYLTGVVGGAFFILTLLQVVSRLFSHDIDWIFEMLRILIIWSVAVGTFSASLKDGHFRVNLGKGAPAGVENPNRREISRQVIIIACLFFLLIVAVPTIPQTRIHPLAVLPGDESVYRIGFIAAVGGMLSAHVYCLTEIMFFFFAKKRLSSDNQGG